MEKNDAQLIRDILSGDDTAFTTLVQKYKKSVHSLAWRKTGDFHHAEEITQDTFLQAYKKLATLRNPHQLAGWLYVIANRRCISWIRKQKSTIQSMEDTSVKEISELTYQRYVSEQRETEATEHRHEIVKRLLQKLPESERTVVTLHYLGEMTVKEIGGFLGVSVNTIHSRLHRARKRLQKHEELLVQEMLGSVQLSGSLTENIVRKVADLKPTPTPTGKPLLPWVAFGTATVLVLLLLSVSNQYLARFQKPYNFEAASEYKIEIIDAPIVLDTNAKPAIRNQIGQTTTISKNSSTGLQISERSSTPNASEDPFRLAETHWMPDANLRKTVREALTLPAETPLTKEHLQRFDYLDAHNKDIADLRGLDFATKLRELHLSQNPITDLRPLVNLTTLESLHLWNVSSNAPNLDLRPLVNLINLEVLSLENSKISDIRPLTAMKKLRVLALSHNHISDFTPISGLTELRTLRIRQNWTRDFSPLTRLNLTDFQYDEVCEIPPLGPPVIERIEKRTFPSVVQAWDHLIGSTEEYDIYGYIYDEPVYTERIAKHDLYFSPSFQIRWPQPWYGLSTELIGNLEQAQHIHQQRLALNPNLVSLKEIRFHNHLDAEAFPPDSDFWVREADGSVQRNPVPWPEYNFNILKPEVQELLINRIVGIAECGLYDGIFIAGFNDQGASSDYNGTASAADLIEAHAKVLEDVRERVREDFLILVGSNRTKIPRHAAYINGIFMNTGRYYDGHGYSYTGLKEIQSTLLWAEKHLRTPQINCFEAQGIGTQPPDSPENEQSMRMLTTLTLTHSNGYVLYATGRRELPNGEAYYPHHEHIWYDFWDADLGQPIDEKAQLYENREGLFIREFTNGWAVYNRSGKPQQIQLPEQATGVESDLRSVLHTIPDLDGEIYLKSELQAPPTVDVNGDGTINVLDLVIVANAIGKNAPDINDDGTVNVLDLVAVANAFE